MNVTGRTVAVARRLAGVLDVHAIRERGKTRLSTIEATAVEKHVVVVHSSPPSSGIVAVTSLPPGIRVTRPARTSARTRIPSHLTSWTHQQDRSASVASMGFMRTSRPERGGDAPRALASPTACAGWSAHALSTRPLKVGLDRVPTVNAHTEVAKTADRQT